MKKDFICINDFSIEDILYILEIAKKVKADKTYGSNLLQRKSIAMIFQKPSNRTRVSFETGIFQLGGNPIYLAPDDISFGARETAVDIAKTLTRFVDGIVARVFDHQDLHRLAAYAKVPVINALSDVSHPCQAMADVLTIQEHFGKLKGLTMAYVGDGNNVCNSLISICAKVGMNLNIATPKAYQPSQEFFCLGQQEAKKTGAHIAWMESPKEAVRNVDVIYTDTWVSMGQEEETARRLKDFEGYQVNQSLVSLAQQKYIFLHCLPAHRGQEVSEDIIDGKHSLIFDEAENRLHAQKAVMIFLYTK